VVAVTFTGVASDEFRLEDAFEPFATHWRELRLPALEAHVEDIGRTARLSKECHG
jgi:hypothetical protein